MAPQATEVFLRRFFRILRNSLIVGAGLGLVALIWVLLGIPARRSVRELEKSVPKETGVMRQRDEEARKAGRKPRRLQTVVPGNAISKNLIHAVLSAEDPNFFGHEGIDWEAIRDSIETNIEKGRYARGGSTITQQLAKNLFFTTHKSLARKAREAVVATWMERDLSKKRIIEIYLNVIEWGDGVYGCEAAARRYYRVSCASLDVDQAAGLAAMIPSPRRINPRTNPKLHALATRRVLRLMRWAGYLKRDIRDMGREVERIVADDSEPEPHESDEPDSLPDADSVSDAHAFAARRDRISSVSQPLEDADVETASANYARRFESAAGRFLLDRQMVITMDLLSDLPGATVLDVGGGHGQTAPALARLGYRVTVLASAPSAISSALRPSLKSEDVAFATGDLRNPLAAAPGSDVVMSYRLLAHARDLKGLIAGLTGAAGRAVVVDYATTRSFNAAAELLFDAKKRVEHNTRPFLVYRDADIGALFEQNGFRLKSRRPQFFWPMALHRAFNSPTLSRGLEAFAAVLGLRSAFGSPVIARFDRG